MQPSPEEAGQILERERATWTAASEGWRTYDHLLVGFTKPVSDRMIDRANLSPGMRVFDLASGTGEPSLSIAERVGPSGSVVGVDLTAPMLEVAREKASHRKLSNIEYRVGDAEGAGLSPGSFDAGTMRFGIMFVPDPLAAMRAAHTALRPGARMVVGVWGPPSENPFLRLPTDVFRRHLDLPAPPPGSPGIFAFADKARLTSTLSDAGFRQVDCEPVSVRVDPFRTGAEYWDFTRSIAGPVLRVYMGLAPAVRARVDVEVAAEAERFRNGDRLELPGLAWVGWGTR